MKFLQLETYKTSDILNDEEIILLKQQEDGIGITVDTVDSVCAELQKLKQKLKKEIMGER